MGKKTKRTRAVKSPKVKGNVSAKKVERAVRIVSGKTTSSSSSRGSTASRRRQASSSR